MTGRPVVAPLGRPAFARSAWLLSGHDVGTRHRIAPVCCKLVGGHIRRNRIKHGCSKSKLRCGTLRRSILRDRAQNTFATQSATSRPPVSRNSLSLCRPASEPSHHAGARIAIELGVGERSAFISGCLPSSAVMYHGQRRTGQRPRRRLPTRGSMGSCGSRSR
jgi:hypothetical protein